MDILVGNSDSVPKVKLLTNNKQNEDSEWTVVHRKSRQAKQGNKHTPSIFLYNIHAEATSKVIWNLFKDCGKVLDIILPRKRDQKNKRFGFVLTTSEEEAGLIILNAKEKGGLGARIRMSTNNHNASAQKDVKPQVRSSPLTAKRPPMAHNEKIKSRKERMTELDGSLGNKMFEFTEATVDEDIKKGLFQTKIGFSCLEEKSSDLQDKLSLLGYSYIKVAG